MPRHNPNAAMDHKKIQPKKDEKMSIVMAPEKPERERERRNFLRVRKWKEFGM